MYKHLKINMVCVILLYILSVISYATCSIIIENNKLLFEFNDNYGSLIGFIDKSTNTNMAQLDLLPYISLWVIEVVDSNDKLSFNNIGKTVESSLKVNQISQTLSLAWKSIGINDTNTDNIYAIVNVNINIVLENDASLSTWSVSIDVVEGTPIGLWSMKITIPLSIGSNSNSELFFPEGYGILLSDPINSTGGNIEGIYPSSQATMQFMALCDDTNDGNYHSGVYMAALDTLGYTKLLQYSTLAYEVAEKISEHVSDSHINKRHSSHARMESEHKHVLQYNSNNTYNVSILSITNYPDDAGTILQTGSTWNCPYNFAIGLVSNVSNAKGYSLWSEAADIYKKWALPNVEWTKRGTLAQRSLISPLPKWYRENSLWINSHWQCHDIFNETGGDPSFVLTSASSIAKLLDQPSIALHWYEWQQGPDPDPSARYKFDTHYPDYFLPRKGDEFRNVVKELQEHHNIYSLPYINGRIYDIASDSYLADHGEQYCVKSLENPELINKYGPQTNLESVVETYGSEATFCVACPYTSYWQDKVAETVDELVHNWDVAGVYIDQIGAADPKLCWDNSHGHALGGGNYWKEGNEKLLSKIHRNLLKKQLMNQKNETGIPPIVTENNAEVYMDLLQGFLVLVAFRTSLAQNKRDSQLYRRLAPAFPYIYGGYYIGFGAEWYQSDFVDHNWFCGKLASSFVVGTQMGWFSLVGINNDPNDYCGPMGVGDLLLSPNNSDLVDFIKKLARFRSRFVDYFMDGYMIRPNILDPPSKVYSQLVTGGGMPQLDYDELSLSAWRLDQALSIDINSNNPKDNDYSMKTIAVITRNINNESSSSSEDYYYQGQIQIDFYSWGYDMNTILIVYEHFDKDNKKVFKAEISGPIAWIPITIKDRDVLVLEFIIKK